MMIYIKCLKCGKVFKHNNPKKIYCNKCAKIISRENVRKSFNKKYHNDEEFKKRKKEKERDKFIHDNFYGLILGTTKIGSHRRWSYKKEQQIIKREKKRVLNGKTYTNPKFQDLADKKHEKIHKNGIKKKEFKSVPIPNDINNFNYVDIVCKYMIDKFKLKVEDYDKEIYGCKKVELKTYNVYIMFRKYKGRVVADTINVLKRDDEFEKCNSKFECADTI